MPRSPNATLLFQFLLSVAASLLALILPVSAGATESFTLVERGKNSDGTTAFTIVDIEPKGPSPGDMEIFYKALYDKDNEKIVGHLNGWCLRTVPFEVWEYASTFILPEGQITTHGPAFDKEPTSMSAITGGTGKFTNASGEVRQVERGAASIDYDDIFTLHY